MMSRAGDDGGTSGVVGSVKGFREGERAVLFDAETLEVLSVVVGPGGKVLFEDGTSAGWRIEKRAGEAKLTWDGPGPGETVGIKGMTIDPGNPPELETPEWSGFDWVQDGLTADTKVQEWQASVMPVDHEAILKVREAARKYSDSASEGAAD